MKVVKNHFLLQLPRSVYRSGKSLSILLLLTMTGCSVEWKVLEAKSKILNNYEKTSLILAKENRELLMEVNRLKFEMEKLRQENIYYKSQSQSQSHGGDGGEHSVSASESHGESHDNGHGNSHGKSHSGDHGENQHDAPKRSISSITPITQANIHFKIEKDLVEYEVYKWKAEDMHKIAESEFKKKNFEKAAQYFYSIIKNYPNYSKINDDFYFKAGVAAFETGNHHEWALVNFEFLMSQYPTSKFFRSAKLWSSLTHLKMGNKDRFMATVEEFRKKYRNSPEWKILSKYYESIEEKTSGESGGAKQVHH